MVVIRTLDNGIKVALESISYVRSISFGIWVKNGSRNELPQENGVSHYIEHMMFKGTENRTARQIAEEMDALGGQINAYTTKEYTCYHTRVLDKHIDRALDVMSDMLLHPLIAEEDVQKERNVITEEIYMYDDAPEELVHDALQDAIWRESSLGMPILGTEETISAFDSKFIRAYYERNYHPDNIVLSVAGNFEIEEMLEKLNGKLGGWTREQAFEQYDTEASYHISCVEKEKDVEQVHTCIAFPGLEREHPQKYAMAIFNTLFGGGMSSRLFQKIREENGLTYSIYSYTSAFADTGIFTICASMNPNQAEKVFELIAEEIKAVKAEAFSEQLIEVTKEQMISNFIIGTESTLNRMTSAGASLLLRGRVQETEEVIEKIEAVTAEDVLQIAREVLDFEKISYSAVGNLKGNDFDKLVQKVFK
ncbi:M16 family metallopeptidase [Anaerotignum sp.]|nr:pitrilysin family protein [Anaerotignum sp.]MBQ7758359.1 insulinase family protein [Anaerotignum sp.]